MLPEPSDPDPDPRDLVRELREACGLFVGALPYSPKRAWEEAIAEVRRLHNERADRSLVLLPRVLLKDARDILWHNPGHLLGGVTDCPGCDLEAQIDAALIDGSITERTDG